MCSPRTKQLFPPVPTHRITITLIVCGIYSFYRVLKPTLDVLGRNTQTRQMVKKNTHIYIAHTQCPCRLFIPERKYIARQTPCAPQPRHTQTRQITRRNIKTEEQKSKITGEQNKGKTVEQNNRRTEGKKNRRTEEPKEIITEEQKRRRKGRMLG